MKQWLNNWEKTIGERLGYAQTKPEGYVWDLIEQDLDAQAVKYRGIITWRIAALALLLLFTASSAYFLTTPHGELAWVGINSVQVQPDKQNWLICDIEFDDSKSQGHIAEGNVTKTILSEEIKVAEMRELDEATASISSAVLPVSENIMEAVALQTALPELASTDRIPDLMDKVDREVISPGILDGVTILPGSQIPLKNQPELHQFEVLEAKRKSPFVHQMQPGVHLLDDRSGLKNEILMPVGNEPSLRVSHSIAHLSAGESNAPLGSNTKISSDDLIFNEDLLAYQSIAEIEAVINEATVADHELAIGKAAWIKEALSELESWKTSLTEQSEEASAKKALEELIDEAILDEEDPLTKRQNEAKDLYRASNINKGFHIGMVTGYQNTWVTKATRNPEVNRSYMEYKFNAGYQIGLNMGYDFTEHFGLMTEFRYSNEGGRYYNPLKQRDQHLDLRYIEIPLYAKIKHSKMTERMRPIVFNYIIGVTYSDLKKINVRDGGIDKRFGQDYNVTEWGISAGFDFDYYFNKNFFWTIGARAGVSGNAKSFPKFNGDSGRGAMSIDAGIYTRLNFRLPGK